MAADEVSLFGDQLEELLNQLSNEELTSLAITITGGLLKNKITTRQDSVKAIVCYSEDITSILKRKIFTRERLLSYLYEKDVFVKLPITKPEIINKILSLWKCEEDSVVSEVNNSCDNRNVLEQQDGTLMGPSDSHDEIQSEVGSRQEVSETLNSCQVQNEDANDEVQSTIHRLAHEFTQWFFKLLNENQLTSAHFFPDASLNVTCVVDRDCDSINLFNNTAAIVHHLLQTRIQNDLFFNPNLLKKGLKAQMDSHGLVVLDVSGTLHSKNVCVGVFQQNFALARDPTSENNWKIKRTDLRLKRGCNGRSTMLCDEAKSIGGRID